MPSPFTWVLSIGKVPRVLSTLSFVSWRNLMGSFYPSMCLTVRTNQQPLLDGTKHLQSAVSFNWAPKGHRNSNLDSRGINSAKLKSLRLFCQFTGTSLIGWFRTQRPNFWSLCLSFMIQGTLLFSVHPMKLPSFNSCGFFYRDGYFWFIKCPNVIVVTFLLNSC